MNCPKCEQRIRWSQQVFYVFRRVPLTCKTCKSEVIPKPTARYSFIIALPIIAMFLVIDPILWGGPSFRHVKYLKQFSLDTQFFVVLTITIAVSLLLGMILLPRNKSTGNG